MEIYNYNNGFSFSIYINIFPSNDQFNNEIFNQITKEALKFLINMNKFLF